MKIYWQLFTAFFKVGLFTFGGGYAMLPLLQKEVVSRGWSTDDDILDYYAIGQVTPGIIAVNVSTFVGYKIKGWPGAICTILGMVTPSVIIITLFASGLAYLWDYEAVRHAFAGIRLVIPALIAPVLVKMLKKSIIDKFTFLILAFAFLLSFFEALSSIYIVILSAILGLAYKSVKRKRS
ncbi:MAG: chromate transporter [Alphaproteobacteria bacterium]|nr:chromate transporter [Alphaproteobacteria bacterium]